MRTFLGRLLEPDFIERAHFITFFFSSVHLMLHSPLWTWPSISLWHIIIVVQLLSDVWLFATPWTVEYQASLSSTICLGVCSNSCLLNQWCHPTMSFSIASFSSSPQSFPVSGSFSVSWLFTWGDQSGKLQLQHQSFQWVFRVDFL